MKAINVVLAKREGSPLMDFVEIEDDEGKSVGFRNRTEDADGFQRIRISGDDLESERVEELEALFELQRSRMKEAVDIWKAETGAEHEPNLGFLLGWLNGRISALEADNKTMKGVITTLRRERRQGNA